MRTLSDCIFCKIITGEIPSKKVYEDDNVYSFCDISPQAPVHILVVPKEHVSGAAEINSSNSHIVANCFEAISKIAESEGIGDGFRVITNSGEEGGQTVFHLHFHILGGTSFSQGLV